MMLLLLFPSSSVENDKIFETAREPHRSWLLQVTNLALPTFKTLVYCMWNTRGVRFPSVQSRHRKQDLKRGLFCYVRTHIPNIYYKPTIKIVFTYLRFKISNFKKVFNTTTLIFLPCRRKQQ